MKLIHLIKKNLSFTILGAGALSLFISNFLLFGLVSSKTYADYSITITYFSILGSFGFLGLDQCLLRLSKITNAGVIVCKNTLSMIKVSGFVFLSGSLVGFYFLIDDKLTFLMIAPTALLVLIFTFYSSWYRLLSQYSYSQLFINAWRILLIISMLIFLFSKSLLLFWGVLFFLNLVAFLMLYFKLKTAVKITLREINSSKTVRVFSFQFLLATGSVMALNHLDKILFNATNKEDFSVYYFLFSFFVLPSSLLQNYVGFKELISFKQNFTWRTFTKTVIVSNILGICLAVLLVLFFYFVVEFVYPTFKINDYFWVIVMFLLTGLVRINYAIISSLNGARGSLSTITKVNIYSTLVIIVSLCVFVFFGLAISIFSMSLLFLINWFLRLIIYYYHTLSYYRLLKWF